MHLILPLLAAVVFALGSMVFKRAFVAGANVSHALVVTNGLLGVVFLPLLTIESRPIPWDQWHLPLATAVAFVAGHVLNVVALKIGDVSLATPLLGAKVLFVGLIGWAAFGIRLSAGQWAAAALATAGVVVMGLTDFHPGRRLGVTTLLALGCAAAFALTDVMIQSWSTGFGPFNFLPLTFVALGLLSAALLPWFGGVRSLRAPRKAWGWILAATGLSGLQSILITGTIAVWQDAAGVNVVYATRGLWTVALVWFAGHWLQNTERHTAGGRVMSLRAAGAALLLLAVAQTAWAAARAR
jgi:drug/metabolite transporter (DMT)-like permease